jgi:hypothetical protein
MKVTVNLVLSAVRKCRDDTKKIQTDGLNTNDSNLVDVDYV